MKIIHLSFKLFQQLSNETRYAQLYDPISSGPVAMNHYTTELIYLSNLPAGSVTVEAASGMKLNIVKDKAGNVQVSFQSMYTL